MVDRSDVERAASNVRINLTDAEVEDFTEEFETILEQFEKIQQVDTDDVEPAFHPVEVEPETREDEIEESISQEEAFLNTENIEDDRFKGPSA